MAPESAGLANTAGFGGRIEAKLAALKEMIREKGSIAVGLSAGVDSALLASVAFAELGSSAVAVTAVSPSLSSRDRIQAAASAAEIGIRHVFIETGETDREEYARNDPMRCFHCKSELGRELLSFAAGENISSIALGVNASDEGDFRPGIRAAEELGICFPLRECGITKQEVREIAKRLGLSSHDRPSNSCLSSRIQYGQRIDGTLLKMVEEAEDMLYGLGIRNVRVRVHGRLARIEVDTESMHLVVEEANRKKIAGRFREIGFTYVSVDLEGFRSGSMNLPLRSSL